MKLSFFLAPLVTKGGEQIKFGSIADEEDELELEEELEDEELLFDLTAFWSLPFVAFTISILLNDCIWLVCLSITFEMVKSHLKKACILWVGVDHLKK